MSGIGALYRISGIGDAPGDTVNAIVDQDFAGVSFVALVNLNCFGLKDMMRNHPEITNTAVKQYCEAKGIDFRIIQNVVYGS